MDYLRFIQPIWAYVMDDGLLCRLYEFRSKQKNSFII
jgi:hypothetical protein